MTQETTPTEAEVLAAAAAIVDAFAATDGDRYFATFAADATFVFHTEAERLGDRAAYQRLWAEWVASGWRVLTCASSDQLVQAFPGGAVFTHTVATTVDTGEGTDSYQERETIVFRVISAGDTGTGTGTGTDPGAATATDRRLIAIHEHLSPAPAAGTA